MQDQTHVYMLYASISIYRYIIIAEQSVRLRPFAPLRMERGRGEFRVGVGVRVYPD